MKRLKSVLAVMLAALMIICSMPLTGLAFSTTDYFRVFEGATWNKDSLKSTSSGAKISVVSNYKKTHDGEYIKIATKSSTDANKTWNSYVLFDNADIAAAKAANRKDIKAYAMFVDFSESASWTSGNLDVAFKLVDKNGKDLGLYKNPTSAQLFSTDTGKKTKVSAQSNGGFRLPKGFIGWVIIPMDKADSKLDYSTVGGISIQRKNTGKVSSFANTNVYFDDVYAIRSVDKFLTGLSEGRLGLFLGGNKINITANLDSNNKLDWFIKWTQISGASKYVVRAYDDYGIATQNTVKTTTANTLKFKDLYMFDSYNTIQVIAYDASGNILAISGSQDISGSKPYEWVGNPTYNGDAAKAAGSQFTDGVLVPTNLWANQDDSLLKTVENKYTPNGSQTKELFVGQYVNGNSAKAVQNMGYVFDLKAPETLEMANGVAMWVDFSNFEYDDYWRIYGLDKSVVNNSDIDTARWGNTKVNAAYLKNFNSKWTPENKPGKMTLIDTNTGKVTTESFVVNEGTEYGTYKIPAGFVGYVFFEFDNKTNKNNAVGSVSAQISKLGSIAIHRMPSAISTSDSGDTSVANVNKISLNLDKKFYVGDIYMVNELDTFIDSVYNCNFGILSGTKEFSIDVVDGETDKTTVKIEKLSGAKEYTVNLFDSANSYELIESKTVTASPCTFTTNYDSAVYAQVIAYDSNGNIISISPKSNKGDGCMHDFQTESIDPPDCTNTGTKYLKCTFCGETDSEIIPENGHTWHIDVDIAATCTQEGEFKKHCTVCNTPVTEPRPAGHKWETIIKKPTPTLTGETYEECSVCKEQKEGSYRVLPALGIMGAPNNMSSNSVVIEGADSAISYVNYGANDNIALYGPSLKAIAVQCWNAGGIFAKIDLDHAEGFAFYIDVTSGGKHTSVNNIFDLAVTTDEVDTTVQNSDTGYRRSDSKLNKSEFYLIGASGGGASAGSQGISYKTYNIRTGELKNGVFVAGTGELQVDPAFQGYVIVNTQNWNNDKLDINDVRGIWVERSWGSTAQDINGTKYSGSHFEIYDNLHAIYDMDTVEADIQGYFSRDGVFIQTKGAELGKQVTGKTVTLSGKKNITPTRYNFYKMSDDGETYERLATNTTGVYTFSESGTYYAQGLTTDKASEILTIGICDTCQFEKQITVDPTVTQPGERRNVCKVCGAWSDDGIVETVPALGYIGLINPMTNATYAIKGADAAVSYASYGGNANMSKYGPSLKATAVQCWNAGGVVAQVDFTYANGFAVYVDTTSGGNHTSINNTFDMAWTDTEVDFTGKTQYKTGEDSREEYFIGASGGGKVKNNKGVTFKTYNMDTGEFADGQWASITANASVSGFTTGVQFDGTSHSGEAYVPAGFRGYIIVDLRNYNGKFKLEDINLFWIERSWGNTAISADGTKYSGSHYEVYDNIAAIYDIATVYENPTKYLSEIGVLLQSGTNTIKRVSTLGNTVTVAGDGFTPTAYNFYQKSADGDNYTLLASNTTGVYEFETAGTYYIQGITKTGASQLLEVGICEPNSCVFEEKETVAPTIDQTGEKRQVCKICGAYLEGDTPVVVPALGTIRVINNANSKANSYLGTGSGCSGPYYRDYGSNAAYSTYGPSLKMLAMQNYTSAGIYMNNVDLSYGAEAVAVYVDISDNGANTIVNNFFDVAWGTGTINTSTYTGTSYNTTTGSAEYIIGADGYGNKVKNNKVTFKTYNLVTGELKDGVLGNITSYNEVSGYQSGITFDGTNSYTGEAVLPTGFKGYIIIDITSYTGARDIEDITGMWFLRSWGSKPFMADGTNKSGAHYVIYDNLSVIYDLDAVLANPKAEFAKVGAMLPTTGITATAAFEGNVFTVSGTAGFEASETITYNFYKLSTDDDTYELLASNTTGTYTATEAGTYYVQAVADSGNSNIVSAEYTG